jgi:hypothetical protein
MSGVFLWWPVVSWCVVEALEQQRVTWLASLAPLLASSCSSSSMACIFATYGRKISTTLTVIQLHFLLFWGIVSGSLNSLPMNSGNCPIRTSSLYFHQQMSSVTKTFSDLSASLSSNFPFPSTPFPSLSSSSSRSAPRRHVSASSSLKKRKSNLNQQLKTDRFLNRLSLDAATVSPSSSSPSPSSSSALSSHNSNSFLSSRKIQNKKRQDLMNELLSPSPASHCSGSSSSASSSAFSPLAPYELIVIGLSHHTASVDIREKLSILESEWNHASSELCEHDSIQEAAVLSTCNRFEMYLVGRNQYEAMTDALNYLLKRTNGTIDEEILRQSVFMLSGQDAIWHLMRVTAGELRSLCLSLSLFLSLPVSACSLLTLA